MKRLSLLLAALALKPLPLYAHHTGGYTATVYDSWYAGRTTACGQTYNHWGVSVAHPWLPCGTKVRINHRGRILTARVTDRCECDIDLSAGAAYRLGVPLDGIGSVSLSY